MTVQELYKVFKTMTKVERERRVIRLDNRDYPNTFSYTGNVSVSSFPSEDFFYLDVNEEKK